VPGGFEEITTFPPTAEEREMIESRLLDAVFFNWQKTDGVPLALYTVTKKGSPLCNSTVSIATLKREGLSYQLPPAYGGFVAGGFPKGRNS
jgi:hypothetical protein